MLHTWEFNPAYYEYLGGFAPDDSHKAKAAAWYTAGVEIIHAAAGGAGNSVMAAAEESMGGMVVGVDVDQSAQSSTVVTSAMKALGVVVQQALAEWKAGAFEGGETVTLRCSWTSGCITFRWIIPFYYIHWSSIWRNIR